jgi:ATP-binding protein involved in chromosome partitioning
LDGVVHPETERGLAEGGYVAEVSTAGDGALRVVLFFPRARDPFAASLRRQAVSALTEAFPGCAVSVDIRPHETTASGDKDKAALRERRLPEVARIVAVAGGKGGVGKSTVTANLALSLAAKGYRVGVLDADIYGPSQPVLFGVEDYLPVSEGENAASAIVPAESMGVKIMSIGFFISPRDALVWRGPMATNALRQLIRQTAWGPLDWLLVDLPPGTGDVHLSLIQELELDGAIVVSTPQSLATSDTRRGVEMFRGEGVGVPVLGIVENMAWFTPLELPDSKYFIFGKGGARNLSGELGIEFLGEIPVVLPAGGGEKRLPAQGPAPESAPYYNAIAEKIVDKVSGGC